MIGVEVGVLVTVGVGVTVPVAVDVGVFVIVGVGVAAEGWQSMRGKVRPLVVSVTWIVEVSSRASI
jgi:hypothetical protein